MSGSAVALVLVAALCHATWNLVAKRTGGDGAFVWLFGAVTTIGLAPASIWALARWNEPVDWRLPVAVTGTSAIHVAYFVLLQRGYREGELSVVYPVARGSGPLLTLLVAVIALDERPGALALLGAMAVLCGIAGLTGLGRAAVRLDTSVRFGLVVGLTIATYTLWDRWAVAEVGVPPVAYFWLQSAGYTLLLTPLALRAGRRDHTELLSRWRPAVAVAALSAASYVTVLEVMTRAPVSLVAPLREVSILLGAVYGRVILGEPWSRRKAISAALVLAGIALMA